MNNLEEQSSLFGESPEMALETAQVKQSLDQLFVLANKYRESQEYYDMLKFVARFRFYAPFNAMLAYAQMPGAKFIAPPAKWIKEYGRTIKPGARPVVILQPNGPVMFVFDVSDTEAGPNARPLPIDIEKPFEICRGNIGSELEHLIENAKRDGIYIDLRDEGSQSAGSIRSARAGEFKSLNAYNGYDKKGKKISVEVPTRYVLIVNKKHNRETQYATILHELAHLYCGHLGTPNIKWWPGRCGLNQDIEETEAESIAFIICARKGIENKSEKYLSEFVRGHDKTPLLSLELVMKVSGMIMQMSQGLMRPRK